MSLIHDTLPGPLYCYHLPMDSARNNKIQGSNIPATLYGNPSFQNGKVGRSLQLDGEDDYVDGGDQSNACLGDLSLCQHGVTISMWWYFSRLDDYTYFFSTGARGLQFYYFRNQLIVEAQQRSKFWKVTFSNPEVRRWYFVEFTWDDDKGLRLYLDLQEVASDPDYQIRSPDSSVGNLFIGRANTVMGREKYAKGMVDQVDICYGDRIRLINLGYILRGMHFNIPLLFSFILQVEFQNLSKLMNPSKLIPFTQKCQTFSMLFHYFFRHFYPPIFVLDVFW